jgi:D-tyrosyl-tRNA(Tyr) deacylase
MKVLIQRVTRAAVRVEGVTISAIERGVLVLLGVEKADTPLLARWYAEKLAAMRLFPDEQGRLWQLSLRELRLEALVVSQFTLAARTRKGRRPSFDDAMDPEAAQQPYREFIEALSLSGVRCQAGQFGAMMQVELVNDGPVTFLLEGPEKSGL